MKTNTGIILVFALAILTSCEGIPGTPGRDGLDGQDGESLLGSVFEIEGDFTSQNDYTLYFEFPNSIEVFESDVVLVYILWEQVEDNNGNLLDVWRLLPQTVVLEEGVLQYNYDHTFADVQVFLEGTISFNSLLPAETDDQVFRIVVLPADYAISSALDVTDFNAVMKLLDIKPDMVKKLDLTNTVEISGER
jgi:hypothetical protein